MFDSRMMPQFCYDCRLYFLLLLPSFVVLKSPPSFPIQFQSTNQRFEIQTLYNNLLLIAHVLFHSFFFLALSRALNKLGANDLCGFQSRGMRVANIGYQKNLPAYSSLSGKVRLSLEVRSSSDVCLSPLI